MSSNFLYYMEFCYTSDTFDTSTDTSDTNSAYTLAINRIRFGLQLTPQEDSYHHSLMKDLESVTNYRCIGIYAMSARC